MNIDSKAASVSLVLLATIAIFYVLVVGKAFLVPLAMAIMIWYVINALSRAYAKILPKVSQKNWITTSASLISIVIFIFIAIDLVENNIAAVQTLMPVYIERLSGLVTKLSGRFDLASFFPDLAQVVNKIEIAPILSSLTGTLANIFLVPIYVLFLMLEQSTFSKKIAAIFPNAARRESILSIMSHAQEDIQTYLWIKTMTSVTTGLVSYLVLAYVDVDFAGFWAFTIFLLNFIPTIGSIIATLFPAMLALVQFDTLYPFLIVLFGVGAIQVLVGNFLEPKLMGNSLNLSPFVVMMSLTLWGSIWGVAGMFLSVPITVMMLIVFAHFEKTQYLAIMLSGDGSLKFVDGQALPSKSD